MSQPQTAKRKVLFVDDDPGFLDMIQRVMTVHSQGAWEVLTAESASQAMGLLQKGPVDLIAIDVQMPVVDGLQFLALLNRRYPDLSKVVLTGFASEAYRVACLSNGAELFLEKPMTAADQKALHAALTGVMNTQPEPEPEEGFRGVLRRVGLADVIQMECLSVGSSVLEISGARGGGRIYIQDGAIVHAEAGSRQGEAALQALLSLRGGEFRLEAFQAPPALTIDAPWEFLLMEAAQKRDESGGVATEDAPARPTPAGHELWSPATPETARTQAKPSPPLPAVQPPAEPLPKPETQSAGHAPLAGLRRSIEEVLICASDGTVLHEWQVRNSDLWVNFIEFLSQKARRVGQGLPLGSFERFEAAEGDLRLITVVGNDRGVLVRCREENG